MPDTPENLAEHYRKLAAEEVAMAKWQSRMKLVRATMRRRPIIGNWRMQRGTDHETRLSLCASEQTSL
jgi:hypothetical protein